MTAALLSGVTAGLAVAVPIGAVATLVVMLGAEHGWRVGAAAGLGAATVDGLYATAALLAGAVLAPLVELHRTSLRWASALVLVAVAVQLARPAFSRRSDGTSPVTAPWAAAPRGARRAYVTVLGLTAVNPTTVVYFAALVAGPVATSVATAAHRTAFVLGAFVASAAWQLALAGAGTAMGRVLTSARGRRWTALVGATVVAVLAARTAVSA